ncbi:uncharacterized protein KGF55_004472 [Candida pseudojiufengensis]|uniref:uncharacterized protein n=1 Tax=Candida pseudojiufengensis TaxID=497109 RepID=UPI00222532C4|nr:uncharacterized protein KGF55_004472 [Candida pseudojiufengensis]KAI5960579.1 hypothetical protein KGF55_004472 [Candida pseudojiufengensis]
MHYDEDVEIIDSEDEVVSIISQSHLRRTPSPIVTPSSLESISDQKQDKYHSTGEILEINSVPPSPYKATNFQNSNSPIKHILDLTQKDCEYEEDEEDDGVFFNCTQMQSAHETVLENEKIQKQQAKSIMSILSFKYIEESNETSIKKKATATTSVKRSARKQKSKVDKTNKSKTKNQSMSKNVRDRYNQSESTEPTPKIQTEQQSRIDEFVKNPTTNGLLNGSTKEQYRTERKLMNRQEWKAISKSIKIKFPKPLFQDQIEIDEIEDSTDEYNSDDEIDMCRLWNESKTAIKLTPQELKILYNND